MSMMVIIIVLFAFNSFGFVAVDLIRVHQPAHPEGDGGTGACTSPRTPKAMAAPARATVHDAHVLLVVRARHRYRFLAPEKQTPD